MKQLLAIALLCTVGVAAAQPAPPKTAEEHYQASKAYYNIEKYDEAIVELKQAYELARDPIYLFNIAQAMRKKNDCAGALDYYRKFLRDAPSAPNRPKVEQWMTEMEACAKTQPKPVVVEPPKDPVVEPTLVTPPVEAKPDPTPAPAPRARGGKGLRVAGLATAATGGVLAIAGGVLAINARGIANGIEDRCNSAAGCNWEDEQANDDKGKSRATLSRVALGVGGAALIGGGVMFMLGRAKGREAPVAIIPTGDGAMVTFGGRY